MSFTRLKERSNGSHLAKTLTVSGCSFCDNCSQSIAFVNIFLHIIWKFLYKVQTLGPLLEGVLWWVVTTVLSPSQIPYALAKLVARSISQGYVKHGLLRAKYLCQHCCPDWQTITSKSVMIKVFAFSGPEEVSTCRTWLWMHIATVWTERGRWYLFVEK
jgi:hypothetical protein